MTMPAPAQPGMPFADVDTPALIIDLDAFERNLERLAGLAKHHGVRLRPHAKTHKSPIIALKQMALGAVGVIQTVPSLGSYRTASTRSSPLPT